MVDFLAGGDPQTQFFVIGDSKSVEGTWPQLLEDQLTVATGSNWSRSEAAFSGMNVSSINSNLSAVLAGNPGEPGFVLINASINDVFGGTSQASYEASLTSILDAVHTKWPSAQCYLMRFWAQGKTTECNTFAGYIDNVIAARSSFAHLGPDERVFLENGDNGATYMADDRHPNAAGYALTATEWEGIILP